MRDLDEGGICGVGTGGTKTTVTLTKTQRRKEITTTPTAGAVHLEMRATCGSSSFVAAAR